MSSVGGLTLYPLDYRAAFASSLIPPPLPHQRPLQSAFPRGEATGLLRSPPRSIRGLGRASRPVVRHPRSGSDESPIPDHVPFWFKPDSIFGLSLVTAVNRTSPGLTLPGAVGSRPPGAC